MTDDSKFVLRWEIDNARARFATGRVESEVYDKGGFKWTIIAEKDTDREDKTNFTLKCDAGHNEAWKCVAEVGILQYKKDGIDFTWCIRNVRFCFDENRDLWFLESGWSWNIMTNMNYCINGNIVLEFRVNIISSESGKLIADPAMFDAPNRMSNVILRIGDEKIHVSKEYLSVHSPVFETLFFSEFAEKGKEEVEIKEVVYEEFLDLLNLIHLKTLKITDRSVVHILKLADRFQMKDALKLAKMYLTESKGIDVMSKLLVADQYNLGDLKEHCFLSFSSSFELYENIQTFPEYDNFSENMKAAMCDKIRNLKPQ